MVCILLPTYQPNPQHLRAALDSLLRQTYADWTLFIHDDASTVDVRSILEPYLKDARITFARSEKRLGIAGNWNACLGHAHHPFILFLFQDDLWDPALVEHAVKAMTEHPTAGLAAVNHRYLAEPAGDVPEIYAEVTGARRAITPGLHEGRAFLREWSASGLRPNIVGEPSFVMLRKSVMDRIGPFNDAMKQGLDMEAWVRALAVSDLAWIPEELGDFRVHAKGTSSINQQSGAGLTDRLRCYQTLLHALPSERRWITRDMVSALSGMVRKLRARKQAGGGTGGMDRAWLLGFGVRHPIISLRALLQAYRG